MSRIIEFRKSAQKAEKQSVQGKTCAFTGHRPQSLPFGFDESDPKFFIADSHDTHPLTHPLIMTSVLFYTKTSLNAIISCTSSQKRCKFLMVLIFKKGKAVIHESRLALSLYSR